MNDYFLKVLVQERQHQLLMEARCIGLQPTRRAAGLWKWKTAVAALIHAYPFCRCIGDGIVVGGRGKGK